jgi:hypothetical protein
LEVICQFGKIYQRVEKNLYKMLCIDLIEFDLEREKSKSYMTFIANNECNTILGGPGSSIHGGSYWSMYFIKSSLRTKERKEKIIRLFNVDREER